MPEFRYVAPVVLGPDDTRFRLLTKDHVSMTSFEGHEILKVAPEALTLLAREAFREIAFFYRERHLEQVAAILDDPEASENDRGVALALLRNAEIASKGQLPMCQDTGTATIVAKKGQRVWTGGRDEEALARGVFETYRDENLRYSQTAPPLHVRGEELRHEPARADRHLRRGLRPVRLPLRGQGRRVRQQDVPLPGDQGAAEPRRASRPSWPRRCGPSGTAACPPYHLVFVIGGTSAEVTSEDRQAGLDRVPGPPPHEGERLRAGLPRSRAGSEGPPDGPRDRASAPSSAASTSPST